MARPRSRSGRMRLAAARIAWPVAAKPGATGNDAANRATAVEGVMGSVRGERDWSKPEAAHYPSDLRASFRPASHSGAGVSRRAWRLLRKQRVCEKSGSVDV